MTKVRRNYGTENREGPRGVTSSSCGTHVPASTELDFDPSQFLISLGYSSSEASNEYGAQSKPASADPCSEPRARASATLIPLSMRDPSYDLPPPYGAFYGPSGSWLERSIDAISPIGDDASRDREDREEDHSRDAGSQSSGAEWPWWKRMLKKREGSRTIRNCANGDGNITIMRLGSTDNLFVENVALGRNNHSTIEVGSSGRLFVKNVGIGSGNVNNIGNFSGTSRDPSSGMRFFSRR